MKFVRVFLLVLIIVGIGLLLTQKIWVPKLVNKMLEMEGRTLILEDKIIPDFEGTYSNTPTPYVKYKSEDWIKIDLVGERFYEYFPKEMADFLDSYRMCQHWGGEFGYDEERAKQISQGILASCIDFEVAVQEIEKKYSNDSRLLEMRNAKLEIDIGKSSDYSFMWNDPKKESKVLNKYIETKAQYILETVKEQMAECDVLVANNADPEKLDNVKFRLGVQKNYLDSILPEIDRLHPITRGEIEALRVNKVFIERAH